MRRAILVFVRSSRPAIRYRSTGRSATFCARKAVTICGRRISISWLIKEGFKTLISQIYPPDDPFIENDVQFGVTRHLLGNFVRHDSGPAPAADVTAPWYSLTHNFVMEEGVAKLPRAPISGKASGERPQIPHLEPA